MYGFRLNLKKTINHINHIKSKRTSSYSLFSYIHNINEKILVGGIVGMITKLFLTRKKKNTKLVPNLLYEDYRRTCVYTGELPLSREEYSKKFYEISYEETT